MPVFIASLISVIAFLYSNDLILVSIIIPIVVLNRFLVLKNNEVGVSDTLFYISYNPRNYKLNTTFKSSMVFNAI